MGVWARGACNFKFGIQLGLGEQLAEKRLLRRKLVGVLARGVSKNFWDPLFICATVEGSNFKFGIQLGLGQQLVEKQLLLPKLARVLARGASQTTWDLFISATAEASNFKFGIELGLGEQLTKKHFQDQNWQGSGLGEYPKNMGPPIYLCNC